MSVKQSYTDLRVDSTILSTNGLSKYFGSLCALEKVDINVSKGEIHGLIGPNGAGKTTFVNLISGILPTSEGKIYFNGIDITGMEANVISGRIGISRTFQKGQVFPNMTCLQNVMVGGHNTIKKGLLGVFLKIPFTRSMGEEEIKKKALNLLESVDLADYAERWADELGWTECQLLQIARSLMSEPRLIILDEPTGGMGASETESVAKIIREIKHRGITVIVISHDMNLVMGIADYITVLDFGQKICDGPPETVINDSKVLEAYLGVD